MNWFESFLKEKQVQLYQSSFLNVNIYVVFPRRAIFCLATKRLICWVSVQGLRPLKDSVFVVFEGESFRDLVNLVSRC